MHLYQHIIQNYERKSCWLNLTYHHYLHDYLRLSGWSQETYVHEFPFPKKLQDLLLKNFYCHYYYGGRNNGWSYKTKILYFHNPSSWITLALRPYLLVWWVYLGQCITGTGQIRGSGEKWRLVWVRRCYCFCFCYQNATRWP